MVHDIRGYLPWAPENRTDNVPHLKDSLTIHWEGEDAIPLMTVDQTVMYLAKVAQYHIQRDWGGGAHGDGIMYHEVIGQNGDSFVCRDYQEVVWHSGNGGANLSSRAIMVLASTETQPNDKQLRALRKRIADFGNIATYPHSYWFATQCPGDRIRETIGY